MSKEHDERAQREDKERRKKMQRWVFSFGTGSRTCPGKGYVMLGIKAVMGATYLRFVSEVVGNDDMM